MPAESPYVRRSLKPAIRRPSVDFSMTGLIYSLMMVFMGFAAMNTQANLLFGVFGLMIGILLVSVFVSRIVLRKLRVTRDLPTHGVVGEPLTMLYHITNDKRHWPSLSVSVAELDGAEKFVSQPVCYMLHAAPGMAATVPVEVIPSRRGLLELDRFQLSTSFPFGFIKRAVIQKRKDSLCVFPALADVDRRVLALCRSADREGQASRPQPGGMDEFYGVREYRAGDSPRHIYWRRSARTGVLVSRDMTRASPPRLLLLVDTFVDDSSRQTTALLERSIAMAASLAWTAIQQELAVGLVAWANEPISLSPTRGKQQRDELLSVLARLPVNTTFTRADLLAAGEIAMKAGATLVVLTARHFVPEGNDLSRGKIVVLSAERDADNHWFQFRPGVEFESFETG